MAMYRLKCSSCSWTTNPHYSSLDCVKEKEMAHIWGIKESGCDAHDSAFGMICPKCGKTVKEEYRYFSDTEIKQIKERRGELT